MEEVQYRSVELNELFAALAKAQADIKVALKDSNNPFFKSRYANLQAVIECSRPALCNNGLFVAQPIRPNSTGQDCLVTILGHSSGQWISSEMKITPLKTDIQSLGSYITYLRRYCYASIVGVYDGTEDDDGNALQDTMPVKTTNTIYKISAEQLHMIENELVGFDKIRETFLKGLKLSSFADLPRESFNYTYGQMKELVAREKSAV
jgi:hypothetical protein